MARLVLVVEGRTEESFANCVLVGHLAQHSLGVTVSCVETSRRGRKGGVTTYARIRDHLTRWMRQEGANADCHFSTMFDLYKLPKDFPGVQEQPIQVDPIKRAERIEQRFQEDLAHPRFVPYIQVHEFEALLFSDITKLAQYFPDREKQIARLAATVMEFELPEHIDDGETTAPSKRIIQELPEYEGFKPIAGPVVAMAIGLPMLRSKCIHFDRWLRRLEALDH